MFQMAMAMSELQFCIGNTCYFAAISHKMGPLVHFWSFAPSGVFIIVLIRPYFLEPSHMYYSIFVSISLINNLLFT